MDLTVTWLTNQPAPYRLPVWECLARSIDLDVLLLMNGRQYAASPGNRGREWAELAPAGYSLRELPTWRVTRGEASFHLTRPFALRLTRATNALVLGGWESPSYLQALFAAKRLGIPAVGFYESTLLSQGHSRGPIAAARRAFFQRLDAVVVPGEAAEEAIAAMNLPELRTFRGFNAVDVTTIHQTAVAERQRTASPVAGHRYLYVGQLISRKNIVAALTAFEAVAQPTDTFTITGSGELRNELEALRIPGVRFTGPVSYTELPHLLAQHDTLVLPSTLEVWGLVANEALAAGLHVVITDRCGVTPSIRRMAGVTVVDITPEALRDGMAESRATWRGPVESPEILDYGPEEFAGTFLDAIDYAVSVREEAVRQ